MPEPSTLSARPRRDWGQIALAYGIYLVLLLFVAAMALLSPNFLRVTNLLNIVTQASTVAVIAVGTTMVILLAEIDLSVGSVAALAGAVTAGVLKAGGGADPVWLLLAVLAGLAIGTALGALNGALTVWGGIPSFIVTLGMLSVGRGLTLLYTGGRPIFGLGGGFSAMAYGRVGPVPVPIIILVVLYTLAALFLHTTQLGRYIYAAGTNRRAVALAGVNVDRLKVGVFALAGTLAGLGGVLLTARLDSAQPTAATGWELDVIAAVVLGGTSLYGGRGAVMKTLVGAIILQLISNGLNLLNVQAYWQQITKGGVILLALLLERSIRRVRGGDEM
ncbi:MAG TPA: ribose ABC transporter permease [Trueperaceae bacterium]|nr:ribose ABC transporter permease [Trueperaceae bacterium]